MIHTVGGGKERSYTAHRKEIRNLFEFRVLTAKDKERFFEWLREQFQSTHDTEYLQTQAYSLFLMWKGCPPPSVGSLKRMIESVIDMFEKDLYTTTYKQLSPTTCSRLDALLHSHFDEESHKVGESEYYAE